MKTLDTTETLFAPSLAESTAAKMNATDDWTYRVVHDPEGTGLSFIEIYDETGDFVAKM